MANLINPRSQSLISQSQPENANGDAQAPRTASMQAAYRAADIEGGMDNADVQIQRGEQQGHQLIQREETASRTRLPPVQTHTTAYNRFKPPNITRSGNLSAIAAGKKRSHDLIRTESDSEVSGSPVSSGHSHIGSDGEIGAGPSKRPMRTPDEKTSARREQDLELAQATRQQILLRKNSRERSQTLSARSNTLSPPQDVLALNHILAAQRIALQKRPISPLFVDKANIRSHALEPTQIPVPNGIRVFEHCGWAHEVAYQKKINKHKELKRPEILSQVQLLGTRQTSESVHAYIYRNNYRGVGRNSQKHNRDTGDVVMIDRDNQVMVAFTEKGVIKTARMYQRGGAMRYFLAEIARDKSRNKPSSGELNANQQ